MIELSPVEPGEACENGGQRIDTGVDDNRNGVLDPNEVDATAYICHGRNAGAGADAPASGGCSATGQAPGALVLGLGLALLLRRRRSSNG